MTRPVRYLALPMASGDAALIAVLPDGRVFINDDVRGTHSGNRNIMWIEVALHDDFTEPPHTAPPEGVADQPTSSAKGAGWIGPNHWACGGICDSLHESGVIRCQFCGTERPPRPAGEAAQ